MACDEITVKVERESSATVVVDVLLRDIHGNFDRNRGGVVHEHEPLQGLMAFLIRACRGKHESRKSRCIIFFARNGNRDTRGKFGGAMFGVLKHCMRKIVPDCFEIVSSGSEMAAAWVLKQE